MCAPPFSRARNDASSPVRRSTRGLSRPRRPAVRAVWISTLCLQTFNTAYNVLCMADLTDAQGFQAAYEEHHRGVYAAAFRVLGDGAQAQDVVQDVFLKLWRKPERFDANRGELGSYLRLMARSRALDLWREGQASGRASDRLKVVV